MNEYLICKITLYDPSKVMLSITICRYKNVSILAVVMIHLCAKFNFSLGRGLNAYAKFITANCRNK